MSGWSGTPNPYPASEERFLGSPLKPGSPADPISSWWVRWAPVQSRAAFYTSNTWGVSNFQSSKIVLGYSSEVRDCLSKPSATSRFESLACFYALSFGKGRRTKPHFQLPNFIRSQIQNHRPLSPKIPPPTKKKELILTDGGRFTACSMLSTNSPRSHGELSLYSVCSIGGGGGSLHKRVAYWEPAGGRFLFSSQLRSWVLVAYTTDQRFLWDLLENINSAALIQKGVFWKCASSCPRKFLHLWYRLGIAEQKQLLHISFSFWLKSSTRERQQNSTTVSRHCNFTHNIFWEVMV